MKLIRRFEYEGYPEELKSSIKAYAAEHGLQEEIEQTALTYTRFGTKTHQMIIA